MRNFNPEVYKTNVHCAKCHALVDDEEAVWVTKDGVLNTDLGDPYCVGCVPPQGVDVSWVYETEPNRFTDARYSESKYDVRVRLMDALERELDQSELDLISKEEWETIEGWLDDHLTPDILRIWEAAKCEGLDYGMGEDNFYDATIELEESLFATLGFKSDNPPFAAIKKDEYKVRFGLAYRDEEGVVRLCPNTFDTRDDAEAFAKTECDDGTWAVFEFKHQIL